LSSEKSRSRKGGRREKLSGKSERFIKHRDLEKRGENTRGYRKSADPRTRVILNRLRGKTGELCGGLCHRKE